MRRAVLLALLASACGKKQVVADPRPPATGLFALLETSRGTVTVRLLDEEAPRAVAAFAQAVEKGLYDGAAFEQVLPDVLVLARARREAGPAPEEEPAPKARFRKAGVLALTSPPAAGQFFLTLTPAPWLDGTNTPIGEAVDGLEALRAISRVPRRERDAGGRLVDRPLDPPALARVRLERRK